MIIQNWDKKFIFLFQIREREKFDTFDEHVIFGKYFWQYVVLSVSTVWLKPIFGNMSVHPLLNLGYMYFWRFRFGDIQRGYTILNLGIWGVPFWIWEYANGGLHHFVSLWVPLLVWVYQKAELCKFFWIQLWNLFFLCLWYSFIFPPK
jgi:hypothetical protein